MERELEVAQNEYNRLWDYYQRITEAWQEYSGNFYKATTIFSALGGAVITWTISRQENSALSPSGLFLFLSLALLVLFIVGWQTIIMMAREIGNSHLYLSNMGALRQFMWERAGLVGITPIHLARDTVKLPSDPLMPPLRNNGMKNNERIAVVCAISSAILIASAASAAASLYFLGNQTPLAALLTSVPQPLQVVSAILFFPLLFGGTFFVCRRKADAEYHQYLKNKRRMPRAEWRERVAAQAE